MIVFYVYASSYDFRDELGIFFTEKQARRAMALNKSNYGTWHISPRIISSGSKPQHDSYVIPRRKRTKRLN